MVRAKFRLNEVARYEGGTGKLVFQAVTSDSEENKSFFKYTPSGKIEMSVVNEAVLDQMEVGKDYYVDFTPAS